MSPRLAIIADDLTGALDAAAPFAAGRLRVRVALGPGAVKAALQGADVLAVSTVSRDLAPADAAAAVASVLADLPAGTRLFKKIDSRMKGQIAAELSAFGDMQMLVVPALPEFGRIVRGGAVQGHGVPQSIGIAQRLGPVTATVPDVETADQMREVIAAADEATLIVGARGAAIALAARMGLLGVVPESPPAPMVIVVGSTDPITLAQVAHLRQSCPDLQYIAAADGVADARTEGAVTLLQAVAGAGANADQVARALAQSVAPMAAGAKTLVLTGGATAEAVLHHLGITVLDVQGDLLPGLPLATAKGWHIVTKSGGFGGAETLMTLAQGADRR